MAVALDAKGTAVSTGAGGTSLTDANLTVSAAGTALVYVLAINNDGGGSSGVSAVWDSGGTNQTMTLINSVQNASGLGCSIYVFGLLNPTTGNKTFKASFTTTGTGTVAYGYSWKGNDTSSFAHCFNHNATHIATVATTAFTSTACTTGPSDGQVGICDCPATGLTFTGVTGGIDQQPNSGFAGSAFIVHNTGTSPTFTCSGTASSSSIFGGIAVNIAAPPVPFAQLDWPTPKDYPRGEPDTYVIDPPNTLQSTLEPPWKRIILDRTGAGRNWIAPPDFNPFSNKVEGIGAGGGGGTNGTPIGAGGGGGAYAVARNVPIYPGMTVPFSIGTGGIGGSPPTAGGDTTFGTAGSILTAKGGGGGGSSGGAGPGGSAASCRPTLGAHSGGSGGAGQTGLNPGAGGGGAAGFAGPGGNGGSNTSGLGSGGGGANAGTAGGNGGATTSGPGGNSWDTVGPAGVSSGAGSPGSNGTGASGSGTSGTAGVPGSNGTEWTGWFGAPQPGLWGAGGGASGPNGATAANGANGGLYGGGGSGTSTGGATAGNGAQGILVITYVPLPVGQLQYPMPAMVM